MARSIKLQGYKEGEKGKGQLRFPNRDRITQFSNSLGDGVRVIMEIREDETELVKSHRGYYWAVVIKHIAIALRDTCGYMIDPERKDVLDMVHDWCKREFLDNSFEMKNMAGESITLPPSTTRLDDNGWKDYLTHIIIFAAEMWGYEIPRKLAKYYFPLDEPPYISETNTQ